MCHSNLSLEAHRAPRRFSSCLRSSCVFLPTPQPMTPVGSFSNLEIPRPSIQNIQASSIISYHIWLSLCLTVLIGTWAGQALDDRKVGRARRTFVLPFDPPPIFPKMEGWGAGL